MNERAPGLHALFILLGSAGISVGIEEIGRLAAVFRLEPALDQAGLRSVLEAVLVKSVEQRPVFERIYQRWLASMDEVLCDAEGDHAAGARDLLRGRRGSTPSLAARKKLAARAEHDVARGAGAQAELDDLSAPLAEAEAAEAAEQAAFAGETAGPPQQRAVGGPAAEMSQVLHESMPAGKAMPARWKLVAALAAAAMLVPAAVWLVRSVVERGRAQVAVEPPNGTTGHDDGVGPVEYSLEVAGLALKELIRGHEMGRESLGALVARQQQRLVYAPELVIADEPRAARTPLYLSWLLVAVALTVGVGMWRRVGLGRWLPSPRRAWRTPRPVAARGPPWGWSRAEDALILDERDEEDVVWGVGRFVSDESGRDLDVERTVDETAAAFGRAVLCYEAARYQREVWLWVDESLDSPVARHLAGDLAMTLEKSGLPVSRATFWGTPDVLRADGEELVTVDALDGRRDGVAVAILTDGRLIAHAHRARERRGNLHAFLRVLSFWPRVTFIDFGDGSLSAILEPHGLRVIQPGDAPVAISDFAIDSAEGDPAAERGRIVGDARVWAAACALTPRPVADRTAFALRRALGLKASPWAIDVLRESAASDAGGLTWSVAHRAELLNWLIDAEEVAFRRRKLPQTSLLARIVDGWDRILDERERHQRRRADERGDVWEGSVDAREIEIERGFIHLWNRPDQAAATLYALYGAGHEQAIRRHLEQMAARDQQAECEDDAIILPWELARLPREARVMLREMGLGLGARQVQARWSMPRPGRIWLAVGLCAGLAAGAVMAATEHLANLRAEHEPVLEQIARPDKAHVFLEREPDADGRPVWRAEARSLWHREGTSQSATVNQRVVARWRLDRAPCVETQGEVEVHRCTMLHRPPETAPERWSFAVLARQDEVLARNVAGELLDSGSVDGVFLVDERVDPEALDLVRMARPGAAGQDDQLLLVLPRPAWPELDGFPGKAVFLDVNDLGRLRGILDFERGVDASLKERLDAADQLASMGDVGGALGDFQVRGLGKCGARGQRCCGREDDATDVCQENLECEQGRCVERLVLCEPGQAVCEDNVARTCLADGSGWEDEDCGDLICDEGQCMERVCKPGASRCAEGGAALEVCNDRGTGIASREPCGANEVCRGRRCARIAGAIIEIESVTLESVPEIKPRKALQLRCTVGDRHLITTSLDPSADGVVTVRRKRSVRIDAAAGAPGQAIVEPIRVQCEVAARAGAAGQETRRARHAFEAASQGAHRLVLRLPALDSAGDGSQPRDNDEPRDSTEPGDSAGSGDSVEKKSGFVGKWSRHLRRRSPDEPGPGEPRVIVSYTIRLEPAAGALRGVHEVGDTGR